jgi:micrococcal nuclease
LNGIDCPEKGQAYGNNAMHAASALAFGKAVTLQAHGYNKYKRILPDVLLPNGTIANHTVVKDTWWYRKYAPGDTVLEGLENDARRAKKGLGVDPQQVPLWGWRKNK